MAQKVEGQKSESKILVRIQRIEEKGSFGDRQPVGSGISELRIHYATGYRVYFKEHDGHLILLLIGGDKSTQSKDIEKAKLLWDDYQKNRK